MAIRYVRIASVSSAGRPARRVSRRGVQRSEQIPPAGSEHDVEFEHIWADPYRVRSANHAIRIEVRFLSSLDNHLVGRYTLPQKLRATFNSERWRIDETYCHYL